MKDQDQTKWFLGKILFTEATALVVGSAEQNG